jgi:ABC-type phosphate/phosphonate transport system permease subunit
MKALRTFAVIGALALMIGELWRSWGVGRPTLFVLDDMFAGTFMLAAAWAMKTDNIRTRAAFAASWGVAVGMLYGSFFGKLIEPERAQAGNWDLGVLTALLGVAFVGAVLGLVLSVVLPVGGERVG